MIRFRPLALALALSLAACATPPQAPSSAPTAIAPDEGQITLDLSSLRAAWRSKHVLAAADETTQVRLTVYGQGIGTPLVKTIPFTDPDGPVPVGTTASPVATFTLAVPAGKNRVFLIEGLNSEGTVLHSFYSAGTVTAGGTLAVTCNAVMDVVGRTILDLLDEAGAMGTKLANEDLTGTIATYVAQATGYDEATNTYSGYTPATFRQDALTVALRSDPAVLATDPTTNESFSAGATGSLELTVSGYEDNYPYSLEVRVFTPLDQRASSQSHIVNIDKLPPGTWNVLAQAGARSAWTTATITEEGNATAEITLPDGAPVPQTDMPIYTETLAQGWTASVVADATATAAIQLDASDPGTESNALAFTPGGVGAAIDLKTSATNLDFGLYGGIEMDLYDMAQGQRFSVQLTDGSKPIGEPFEIFSESGSVNPRPVYRLLSSTGGPFHQGIDMPNFAPIEIYKAKGLRITYLGAEESQGSAYHVTRNVVNPTVPLTLFLDNIRLVPAMVFEQQN